MTGGKGGRLANGGEDHIRVSAWDGQGASTATAA